LKNTTAAGATTITKQQRQQRQQEKERKEAQWAWDDIAPAAQSSPSNIQICYCGFITEQHTPPPYYNFLRPNRSIVSFYLKKA
jgi:hypothetical protein